MTSLSYRHNLDQAFRLYIHFLPQCQIGEINLKVVLAIQIIAYTCNQGILPELVSV
jgi:hypothetical protein